MKVAIYCRLSKDDEVRKKLSAKNESESIRNQKSILIQYAIDRGYDIHDIYVDEDYSGADRDRPAFNRLIEDASQHKFDIVLAKSQSRFTRDMELVEKYLHGKFMEWGIRFIAVVDHADTDDVGNKKSRQINGLVNEWYLEDLSSNVRTVLTHKRKAGQYIGSFALYGYQKDPTDHNHLIVDPEAAEVVRKIFAMALDGFGVPKIVRTLNEAGIPNPTSYKHSHGMAFYNSNPSQVPDIWTPVTVHAMLKNRMYTGAMVQGRHKKASYKSKKTLLIPQENWIVIPDTHEAIIEKGDFDRLQELRSKKAIPCQSTGKIRPLAKKVFCGCCGSTMQLCGNGKHHQYLRCKVHTYQPSLCQNRSIPVPELNAIVLEKIQQHLATLLEPQKIDVSSITKQEEKKRNLQCKELHHFHQEFEKREFALRMLYQDKKLGLIDDEMFLQLNAGYIKEKEELAKRIDELETELANAPQDEEVRRQKARDAAIKLGQPTALTRELVCALIDKVKIGPITSPTGKKGTRSIEIQWLF